MLELHNANGAVLARNDNWQQTQNAVIRMTGLAPTNPKEAAVLITLVPGPYTVVVHGQDHTRGLGLVEVYNLN